MPHVPLQSACLALSEVLVGVERKLSPDQMRKLIALGAALWKRSQELGEDVLDIHHIIGAQQ